MILPMIVFRFVIITGIYSNGTWLRPLYDVIDILVPFQWTNYHCRWNSIITLALVLLWIIQIRYIRLDLREHSLHYYYYNVIEEKYCILWWVLLSHPGIPAVTLCFCSGRMSPLPPPPPLATESCSCDKKLLNDFSDFCHFGRIDGPDL